MKMEVLLSKISAEIKEFIKNGKYGTVRADINLTSQGGIGDVFIHEPGEKVKNDESPPMQGRGLKQK